MPPRACLDCYSPIDAGSVCDDCRKARSRKRDALRPSKAARGYDAAYLKARKELLANNPICHWCKKRSATTADHYPPLSEDPHSKTLVPACTECNYGKKNREASRGMPNP